MFRKHKWPLIHCQEECMFSPSIMCCVSVWFSRVLGHVNLVTVSQDKLTIVSVCGALQVFIQINIKELSGFLPMYHVHTWTAEELDAVWIICACVSCQWSKQFSALCMLHMQIQYTAHHSQHTWLVQMYPTLCEQSNYFCTQAEMWRVLSLYGIFVRF